MHADKQGRCMAVRSADTGNGTFFVSRDQFDPWIQMAAQQIITGAMEVLNLNDGHTGAQQCLCNGVYISGHLEAGLGPFGGEESGGPPRPAARAAFDVGHDENFFRNRIHRRCQIARQQLWSIARDDSGIIGAGKGDPRNPNGAGFGQHLLDFVL